MSDFDHIESGLGVVAGLVPATTSGSARAKVFEVAGTSPATTAVEVLPPDRSRPQNGKERAGRPRSGALSINSRNSAGVTGYRVIRTP